MAKGGKEITIRSSAAEYLTFIAATGDNPATVEMRYKVREIRMSERKFYQKITDIYATALDYDQSAQTTRRFFSTVRNKLHWAIHGHTAAEVIYRRADAEKQRMGLTSWQDAPDGKIIRADVAIAKNYLTEEELQSFSRIVNAYLDIAEDMAQRKIPMTMENWEKRRTSSCWRRTARFCLTRARLPMKLQLPMPKASLRNTGWCRIGCSGRILTGFLRNCLREVSRSREILSSHAW
jgi:hypothetical protein